MTIRATQKPSMIMRLTWQSESKRWLLSVDHVAPDGSGGHSYHRLDVQEPLDAVNAHRLVAAVKAELESWLPVYGSTWATSD